MRVPKYIVPSTRFTVRSTGRQDVVRVSTEPISVAASDSTRAPVSTTSSVIRDVGPDIEIAMGCGALGTATATQRTPTSCSPSSSA